MKQLRIIVPYRNGASHLATFIPHMRARMKDCEIIVVEQADQKPFNRAKLLNVGFLQSKADYFAFHDVDMLPVKADYSFPVNPTHIATKCSQFRYKMPFAEYFGGVTLFNREDFIACNGYSNNFWSWGAEDNEMYDNVLRCGLKIDRRDCTFQSLHHQLADRSCYEHNRELWMKGRGIEDGLSHCSYNVINRVEEKGFIRLIVDLTQFSIFYTLPTPPRKHG